MGRGVAARGVDADSGAGLGCGLAGFGWTLAGRGSAFWIAGFATARFGRSETSGSICRGRAVARVGLAQGLSAIDSVGRAGALPAGRRGRSTSARTLLGGGVMA